MNKHSLMIVCLIMACVILSGCRVQPQKSMIKSERRLEKYFTGSNSKNSIKSIDLSDGQKLRYEARFGPNDLNFDMKIVDPY